MAQYISDIIMEEYISCDNSILEGMATQEEKDKLKNSHLNSEDIYND